ncbi:MAG: hypothetical protein IPH82_24730 [Chloroflexi bacterium]|nr:hypothetical protein [Chloroflexota bacterium]
MNELKTKLAALPTFALGGRPYLSYQAVTDTVAAFYTPAPRPPPPTPLPRWMPPFTNTCWRRPTPCAANWVTPR